MIGKIAKKILPRSLFARSLIILITPILLVQIVTTLVFFDNHWSRMTSRLAYAVAGEIRTTARMMDEAFSKKERNEIHDEVKDNLDLEIFFEENAILDTAKTYKAPILWEYVMADSFREALKQQLGRPFTIYADFEEKWVYVDVQLKNGIMHVKLPQRRLFSSSGYIVLLWMFGASLLLLIIAILFMRNQIRPIRKLAIAAERFGKGGELVAFKPGGAREVRQAAEAFLEMHKRIRRQIDQRTMMLAGVSHDLRTPLTRLKLQLEMLGDNKDVQAMKSDVDDMQRMIAGYLDFARGESGENTSFTNIGDLLRKIIAQQKPNAEKNIQGDIHLMLRPMAMERCLTNIIRNAQQYGDKIWVSLESDGLKCAITIEDNGPGIPQDQYEDVFKPFYRVDKARKMEDGHVGLGLSIAMDIVHSHGGKIKLAQSAHGGLKVIITLPL